MCKCLPKSLVTRMGLIFTIFMILVLIPCIVLSGVDYQQTDMRWSVLGQWRTAGLKVGAVVVAFVAFVIGLLLFTCLSGSKVVQGVFVGVNGLSTLLSFSIAVVALVWSVMSESEATRACRDTNKGLFQDFLLIDRYFHLVDEHLCALKVGEEAKACQCRFTNSSAIEDFEQNLNYYNAYKKYSMTEDMVQGVVKIQNCLLCPAIIVEQINKDADFVKAFGNQDIDSFNSFATYWSRIEESFECSGWCNNQYIALGGYNDLVKTGETRFHYKYLFSDINSGPVQRTCMAPLMKWIKKTMKAYGGLLMIVSVIQGLLFALALALLLDLTFDSKSERNESPDIDVKDVQ